MAGDATKGLVDANEVVMHEVDRYRICGDRTIQAATAAFDPGQAFEGWAAAPDSGHPEVLVVAVECPTRTSGGSGTTTNGRPSR
jgi:hypothetical protein